MKQKRKTRQLAMQVLYLWDCQHQADRALGAQAVADGSDEADVREEAVQMAWDAWEFHAAADEWVSRLAPHWPVARQAAVDRAILRLAVWEMTHTITPPKVVIDEAIEMGKEYSTENSPGFLNGVLDAVLKEHRELIGHKAAEPAAAVPTDLTAPKPTEG
jgi:transcription antitermination protein NusB